jgi:cyanophycinase
MNSICRTMTFIQSLAIGLITFASVMEFPAAETSEPANGKLILIGGGSERGAGIVETFINCAGGVGSKFVIIPTAHGNRTPDGGIKVYTADEVLGIWKSRGLTNLALLHTSDPKVANSDDFVRPLREANAVWIDGDSEQDLLASYLNTLTQLELKNLLARGGVIAGNGAGAACLGARLLRAESAGAGSGSSQAHHQPGFALLPKSVIDLQVNTRNRWHELQPMIESYPDLLGIGLSESTAIVVTGNRFEVIGKWKVAVVDASQAHRPWAAPQLILEPGDVFNLTSRKIERLGDGTLKPPPLNPSPPTRQSTNAPATN